VSADKPRRAALGRGLGALIQSSDTSQSTASDSDLTRVPLSRVRPNPYQPRRVFDPSELAELESSLKESGLLQPISVRRKGDAFELIAGERRLRAASNLGWTEIPAIIRELDDRTMLVLALVENLQRANLNAIEEAAGYRRLMDEFALTQQQIAVAVGKDRTTVTNLLRMLSLPGEVQDMVREGSLSGGHARALLSLAPPASPLSLAREAVAGGLSVRDLERRVRELNNPETAESAIGQTERLQRSSPPRQADPAVQRIEDELRRYLQTDVKLRVGAETKGTVEIAFYSNDDLTRLLELIVRDFGRDF
jgi:ParB family transcriptional regulator, chromosome partitioning protein